MNGIPLFSASNSNEKVKELPTPTPTPGVCDTHIWGRKRVACTRKVCEKVNIDKLIKSLIIRHFRGEQRKIKERPVDEMGKIRE